MTIYKLSTQFLRWLKSLRTYWKAKIAKTPLYFLMFIFVVIVVYNFSYYIPFTNNAFVVANIRPVAANVNGYITDIYVKNQSYVKKGEPLFTVFKTPYALAYQKACSDLNEAIARLPLIEKKVQQTQDLIKSQQELYQRLSFDHQHYQAALHDHAVSAISVNTLLKEKNAAWNKLNALKKLLEWNQQKRIVQESTIAALRAVKKSAKVDLDETTVYAKNNGIVQNLFAALGTPIQIRKPIFSFVDTDSLFIQANFSELDLRRVRAGNRVLIIPRMYLGDKIYHGVVTSTNWAASRQTTDNRSQQQIVTNNENNWFLLPQRFPVQIQVVDYDPSNYPLAIGSSAYVYIHTG